MKIYTKTGDRGETSLFTGRRVSKSHGLIDTFGLLDELNVYVGLLASEVDDKLKENLLEIQSRLFSVGTYMASDFNQKQQIEGIDDWTLSLENTIDQHSEKLPHLKNFILPGGDKSSLFSHLCRVKSRNVERQIVGLGFLDQTEQVVRYLNRLSDYFFSLARFLNFEKTVEEITWKT